MKIKCVKCNSKTMHIENIKYCAGCKFNGAWDEPGVFVYDQDEINEKNLEREEVKSNGCCKYGDAAGDGCWMVTCANCGTYVFHIPKCI